MEQKKNYKRTTVTAALPYANGGVHIGHLAGVYVPADIYVRYLRLKKQDVRFICGSDEHGVPITIRAKKEGITPQQVVEQDVRFICGSDEHGVPITIRAKKEGITPQQVVDRYHAMIKKSFADFGISFDIYSRTTSDTHSKVASDFFKKLYEEGKLVEKTSMQYYDEEAHQFLADRYITGECPHCHNPKAYGDQCEKCGSDLDPTELINPKSAISGSQPVLKETKNWYLPLNEYQDWLKQWILEGHKEWRPNVYGQCKSWLDLDLQPRAMTRDLDWGIPVPVDGAEGKVLYVWFDAPIGYISNTQELMPEDWEKWWKDPETRLVHFIGKDNIVFHCIVFPTMLKTPRHASFTSSVRTTSCSTASCSPQCLRLTEATSCPTTYLQTSSSTLRTTRYLHHATGRYGSTNTSRSCPASRMCCAMCSPPTRPRQRTTTSHGKTSRSATTANWLASTATS
ncbi:methionine--tRNA ligase [Prevotella sp. CAG:1058]|nr:methionine--tRNA ligase [Prevotella sp. CAG:1058]